LIRGLSKKLSVLLTCSLILNVPGEGQELTLAKELEQSQSRLNSVREHRLQLQQQLQTLDEEIHGVSARLVNIEQQISISRSVLDEMRFQTRTLGNQIAGAQRELFQTKDEKSLRSAVLNRRLRDIYKRGPLHTLRVMLSSESFSELLTTYRYLYLASYRDRSLLQEVKTLEEKILDQTKEIQKELSQLSSLQYSGLEEVITLRNIENIYQETLLDFTKEKDSTSGQIEKLTNDESRISDLIKSLESRRAELARRAMSNSEEEPFDPGNIAPMNWPVKGPLIYNFGMETRPDGNTFRWDGIGIQAEIGTPVYAVRAGTVVLAGPFEGYGPTVVLSHGAGFYTLYLYLEDIEVTEGRNILEGDILGSVGGMGTPEGPHIEFQIRIPIEEGRPEAQDPLRWLIPS